jgi:hypothetical protein
MEVAQKNMICSFKQKEMKKNYKKKKKKSVKMRSRELDNFLHFYQQKSLILHESGPGLNIAYSQYPSLRVKGREGQWRGSGQGGDSSFEGH